MSNQPIVDTPENWDGASSGYAERVAPKLMESFAEELVSRLQVDDQSEVLEVAAGSGALSHALAPKVQSLLITDFSSKMLAFVEKRMQNLGFTNCEFANMDGQHLDLNDNIFDRAACQFGLMLFPDRAKGFSELHRILKPRGSAVISGWTTPDRFEAFGVFLEAMNKAFPEMPKPDSPPPVFSLANPDVFKQEMEEAGFRNVKIDVVSKQMTIDSVDEMWAMLTAGAPPVQMLFDKIGEEGKSRLKEVLHEVCHSKFGSDSFTLSNAATIGVGEK